MPSASVARIERSAIGFLARNRTAPDFASLHPGYLLDFVLLVRGQKALDRGIPEIVAQDLTQDCAEPCAAIFFAAPAKLRVKVVACGVVMRPTYQGVAALGPFKHVDRTAISA